MLKKIGLLLLALIFLLGVVVYILRQQSVASVEPLGYKYKDPSLGFYINFPDGYNIKDYKYDANTINLAINKDFAAITDPALSIKSFIYDERAEGLPLQEAIIVEVMRACDASGPQGSSYCKQTESQVKEIKTYKNSSGSEGFEFNITSVEEIIGIGKTERVFGPFIVIYTPDSSVEKARALIIGPTSPVIDPDSDFYVMQRAVTGSLVF